jgi:sugar phosphate isomerase/epimerase
MLNRRQLLHTTIGLSSALSIAATAHQLPAIEPFERPAKTSLRISLSAYSFRKYLTPGDQQSMDLFQFVDWCHDHDVLGVELTSYYFPDDVNNDYLVKLKRHCHLRGVTISGGAIRNDYCSANDEAIRKDIEHTKLWIDRYAMLGAPVIRIFAGTQPEDWTKERTIQRCARACNAACEYAKEKGVILALENHGGITALADDLLSIVNAVKSDAFGVNFDSGNFRSTADPYAELAKIAPFAVNAQIKVEMFPNGVREETDFKRVISILREAHYSGWLALEYEAEEEPKEAVPTWLGKLREVILA